MRHLSEAASRLTLSGTMPNVNRTQFFLGQDMVVEILDQLCQLIVCQH
jgi:hypothetical protein